MNDVSLSPTFARLSLALMIGLVAILLTALPVSAGSIFVTGHDPLWHAQIGGNKTGARNLAMTGIDFARDGSALPFLFIESKTHPVPSGNFRTAPFLSTALGFTAGTDFVHMEASELSALADFRATLSNYSAIWVASDHGGMLTASELTFLNDHSADIIDYLNAGGGLFAEAESNQKGLIGATPRFGFLPFLVASTDFGAAEISNTVTSFGASLGLTNSDVNGNFSHNYFSATGGMNPVDLFNGDSSKILSLAFRGQVGTTGVTPSLPLPSPILLFSIGLIGMIGARVITRPESR